MKIQLRPHQEKGIQQLRAAWKEHKKIQFYACVAFGKTATAAYIIDQMTKRGKKVMFTAPYTVLVEQTAQRFIEYGLPKPSIIWRDHPWYAPDNPIQIASSDTLIRRGIPEDLDLLIIDECHLKRKKILEYIKETGAHVIGLSGTPYADWMGEYYTTMVKPVTMREMIDAGYLSDYEIFAPTKPSMKGVKTVKSGAFGYDYREGDIAEVMGDSKIVGDIVKTWLQHGENEATIAFCVNVAHANQMTIEFNRVGVNADVVTGDTPHEARKEIFRKFDDGIIKIILSVGVLIAGFDRDVRNIIYARPTKSEIRWVQSIGRGLRTAHGKCSLRIFDHSGTVYRLGLPCSIEYDELQNKNDGLQEQKRQQREKERKEKLPKKCPKCDYMKPAGQYVCAKCGFKPLNGEDVETDTSRDLEKITGKEKKYTKEEKQAFYSELWGWRANQKIYKGKEYNEGYIAHLYKSKFGVFPKGLHKSPKEPQKTTTNYIRSRQIAFAKSKGGNR